jgi:hypothetical protein
VHWIHRKARIHHANVTGAAAGAWWGRRTPPDPEDAPAEAPGCAGMRRDAPGCADGSGNVPGQLAPANCIARMPFCRVTAALGLDVGAAAETLTRLRVVQDRVMACSAALSPRSEACRCSATLARVRTSLSAVTLVQPGGFPPSSRSRRRPRRGLGQPPRVFTGATGRRARDRGSDRKPRGFAGDHSMHHPYQHADQVQTVTPLPVRNN